MEQQLHREEANPEEVAPGHTDPLRSEGARRHFLIVSVDGDHILPGLCVCGSKMDTTSGLCSRRGTSQCTGGSRRLRLLDTTTAKHITSLEFDRLTCFDA